MADKCMCLNDRILSEILVMSQIKLEGMKQRTTYKHIFCLYRHSLPLGLDQNAFLKSGLLLLHYRD